MYTRRGMLPAYRELTISCDLRDKHLTQQTGRWNHDKVWQSANLNWLFTALKKLFSCKISIEKRGAILLCYRCKIARENIQTRKVECNRRHNVSATNSTGLKLHLPWRGIKFQIIDGPHFFLENHFSTSPEKSSRLIRSSKLTVAGENGKWFLGNSADHPCSGISRIMPMNHHSPSSGLFN